VTGDDDHQHPDGQDQDHDDPFTPGTAARVDHAAGETWERLAATVRYQLIRLLPEKTYWKSRPFRKNPIDLLW
jgi:hypothetical protein